MLQVRVRVDLEADTEFANQRLMRVFVERSRILIDCCSLITRICLKKMRLSIRLIHRDRPTSLGGRMRLA